MTPDEIREQERLDDLDPLRHLSNIDDESLVPSPPQSIQKQEQTLQFDSVGLKLLIDAGPGCGGIAWPAGQVLSQYLVSRGPQSLRDRHVLELGSGTGLVGLVAAHLGASNVIITDQLSAICLLIMASVYIHDRPLLDIMNQNIALNHLQDKVTSLELDWWDIPLRSYSSNALLQGQGSALTRSSRHHPCC